MANKAGTAKIALPYQRKRAEFGRPPPVKQDALGGPWVSVKKAAENTWTMFQDRSRFEIPSLSVYQFVRALLPV